MKYLAVDIGGTRIKATIGDGEHPSAIAEIGRLPIKSMPSPLIESADGKALSDTILRLVDEFGVSVDEIGGIGISTTGIVDYAGTKVLNARGKLKSFATQTWKENLERAR